MHALIQEDLIHASIQDFVHALIQENFNACFDTRGF